jgi:hypothetical protein
MALLSSAGAGSSSDLMSEAGETDGDRPADFPDRLTRPIVEIAREASVR